MSVQAASLIERLSEAENPRKVHDWEKRDGYYVAACRVSTEDVPGLVDIVRKWCDPNWLEEASDDMDESDDDREILLPVTAWRTLADLKADAAVEPLVDMLCAMDDEFEDWASEELPHVFGKIGETAIGPLVQVATNDRRQEFIRSIAVCGLRCVAQYHADTRDRIVAGLTEMMAQAVKENVSFNSTLLVELVELRAVQAAEPIERAFASNLLDVGMMGDWEEVRRQLGVEGLGLTMPVHPYNSLEGFRDRMGFGIFSDRSVFIPDDIDHEAAQTYYERAFDTFSQSSEAQQVIERHGDLQWIRLLLEFGINYRGEIVDTMKPESVSEFVLDHVPGKVSMEADGAASIIYELGMFWRYLDRVYELPAAKSIVEWLRKDGLVARLEAAMSDPSNFGMAKSLVMMGKKAGFDMTSEAGLAEFMKAYNRSQATDRVSSAAPTARNHRVGRNEPCPCGSGKKFKKCCGGSGQHDSPN